MTSTLKSFEHMAFSSATDIVSSSLRFNFLPIVVGTSETMSTFADDEEMRLSSF
jgi:hypothetical protein